MIITDHQSNPVQTPLLQSQQKLLPAVVTLPRRIFHRQNLAPTLPIDPQRHQNSPMHDVTLLPHPLVTRIQYHIRILRLQRSLRKLAQLLIQPPRNLTETRSAKLVPAQLFGDGGHLPRADPLHIHLCQRGHQRLLTALILLKNLRAELPAPILRHPQHNRPHPRHQPPPIIPAPIPGARRRPLISGRLQTLFHLQLQHRLHRLLHHRH